MMASPARARPPSGAGYPTQAALPATLVLDDGTRYALRRAVAADLPDIVAMFADDPLGAARETLSTPLPASYGDAFAAIERDPNQELVVVTDGSDTPVGVLQLTFVPGLTHRGAWRAQIEGVRIAATARAHGLGHAFFAWAIARARARGCSLVQLTTDKSRVDAQRFYAALGFVATHEGMKLHLDADVGRT